EIVERQCDLVRGQRPGLTACLEERPRLLGFEYRHLPPDDRLGPAHAIAPPVKAGKLAVVRCNVKRPVKKAALLQTQRTDAIGPSAHLVAGRAPGKSPTHRVPTPLSRSRNRDASIPSVVRGPAVRARLSSSFAFLTLPSQSSERPRWNRTL